MSTMATDLQLKVYVPPAYKRLFTSLLASVTLPKKEIEIRVDPELGTDAHLVLIPHENLQQFAARGEYVVLDKNFPEEIWDNISPIAKSLVTTKDGFVAVPLFRREGCPPTHDFVAISKSTTRRERTLAINALKELCTESKQLDAFWLTGGQLQPCSIQQRTKLGEIAKIVGNRRSAQPVFDPSQSDLYWNDEHISLPDTLNNLCPDTVYPLPVSPESREEAISTVNERSSAINPVLEQNYKDLGLSDREQYSKRVSTTSRKDDPSSLGTVVTPVTYSFKPQEFEKAVQSSVGVIIGAVFGVNDTLEFNFHKGTFDVGPGQDYAIKLKTRRATPKQATVYFVDANGVENRGESIELTVELNELQIPTDIPVLEFRLGSCRVCGEIKGHSFCITVRSKRVAEGIAEATNGTYTCTGD